MHTRRTLPGSTRTKAAVALISLAAVLILAVTGNVRGQSGDPDAAPSYRVEVPLQNHLQLGMNEQDVFIADGAGSGQVRRVTADDADASAELFAAAAPTAHNPVDPADVGPFDRGASLGLTQGEWLEGAGQATITCEGDTGTVEASFESLVPNGVYTLWYFFMPMPTAQPFSTYDLPLGARDGSQNTFVADADGRATYEVEVSPCLQLSGRQLLAGLAAAYHSDGATYGAFPGEFGTITHLHVFNFLPDEATAVAQ